MVLAKLIDGLGLRRSEQPGNRAKTIHAEAVRVRHAAPAKPQRQGGVDTGLPARAITT